MKIRVLLLSLATVLLLSCSATDEIESFTLKSESMNTETKTVSSHIAGVIQMNAQQFNCEIVEVGLAGGDTVRISVKGTDADLENLFAYVNESTGTETV